MKNVKKNKLDAANFALIEGNRDEVLEIINTIKNNKAETVWLRVNSIENEEKRNVLVEQIAGTNSTPYSGMARAILRREREFQTELDKPPSYQFWKHLDFSSAAQKTAMMRTLTIPVAILIFSVVVFVVLILFTSS